MANWRDSILKDFQPRISRLTVVADPDGLLTEEGMLAAIRERGFDLIPFDDSIAFRFAYESQYRSLWDSGINTDLVVVLRAADQQLNKLPFDLLRAGRQLTFALHQLFPKLNYPVIAGLDRAYLDSIFDAYQKYDGAQLTERETKEFVLMHCFSIVPKLINTPAELLKVLLSLHSRKVLLPAPLADFLLATLAENPALSNWPLNDIFNSREKFFRFLQEEWSIFLAFLCGTGKDSRVPFSHEDVRVYIDTMFLDGSLAPVEQHDRSNLPAWALLGVIHDPISDSLRRFRGLRKAFQDQLPASDVSHREWQQVSHRWAELVVLRWELDDALNPEDKSDWSDLHIRVEKAFAKWMLARYATLHNLPYNQEPVMVHQIIRFLSVERTRNKLAKIALLVLDGLALDQWIVLRRLLETSDSAWQFEESSSFAWVPSITSISRQSIFAGEPPLYFGSSLETTAKEQAHWHRFWEDQGVPRDNVDLVKALDGPDDAKLETALSNPRLSILGLVWNKVDDIMHGMEMQTAGMHNQVRLWASQGHLNRLLLRLHTEGFVVYITADHGNVTAKGIGNPREGILAETHGERVRVYDRSEFRDDIANKFPQSVRWPSHGLPPERHVLLSGDLNAFTQLDDEIVCHGGIALEEVIVPFVSVSRRLHE